jgi:2-oxoglutarate ferredoxin oxidoreductase subunit beta
MTDHLAGMIQAGIAHPGFSLIDILQPCVSFNKVNTFKWYKERCRDIAPNHDPSDWDASMKLAFQWDEWIPVGVIYKNDRAPFESHVPACAQGSLAGQALDKDALNRILMSYA